MKWETPVSDLGTVFINTKCKWYRTSLEGRPHFLIKMLKLKQIVQLKSSLFYKKLNLKT